MMFIGNPGTGKTDTARIVGRIYGKLGLLPKPDLFIQASRASLIGAYMGHSEKATKELIESAIGGVLFIDEAHRIVSGDQDEYGKQAFGVLIKMMEDYRDRLMVIFAGYENMEQVLSKYDPGITSRIPTRLHFDDYSQEELLAIFEVMLKKNYFPLVLDEDSRKEASALIRERSTMQNFGNARGVRNIADDVVRVVKRRLNKEDEEIGNPAEDELNEKDSEPVTVLKEDIMASGHRKTEGRTLEDYKQELDEMIGLNRIKEEVRTMEDKIFMERARIRMGEKPSENFLLHSVFYGNAGTGKTTVAKLIGQIYNKMGALPAGDVFVTVTRGNLVAEYEGQTAIKTRSVVESALGGVLFIDEAYALCTGPEDLFGMEALNTLLTLAVDYRDRLMIILAGYEGPIKRLMNLNQGLERRFPNQFHFEDYTEEELYQIFCKKLKDNSRVLEDGASDIIKEVIQKRNRRSSFGNGGGIDNIMKDLIGAQAVRLRPYFDSEEMTPELFRTITAEDAKALLTAGRDE
jgi:SpoVK/Ycf46/Vps4 family AAA+-type ATPase